MGECLNEIIFRINPTILKYVPHRHRATYLNTHDLRTSTPTPYVVQRLAARTCLEAPFITFGGSIHDVWRLHSLRLETPNALVRGCGRSSYSKKNAFRPMFARGTPHCYTIAFDSGFLAMSSYHSINSTAKIAKKQHYNQLFLVFSFYRGFDSVKVVILYQKCSY